MLARRAPLWPLVLALAVAPSTRARASCNSFPYDALCGSSVSSGAVSGNNSVAYQNIDAASTVAVQSIGPAYTDRLADPTDQAGEGNIVHESSRETIAIDQGVMAIEMGADSDAHALGLDVSGGGIARIAYAESIQAQSATVPQGTQVTAHLHYQVAFGAALVDSADPSVVDCLGTQYASFQLEVTAQLDNHLGVSGSSDSLWDDCADFPPSYQTGVFVAPYSVVDLSVPVQVGQSFTLSLSVNGAAGSEASFYHLTADAFPTAGASSTVAVVFGMQTDTPGVDLVSGLLGGPLPGLGGVTAAHALASAIPIDLGPPVSITVPEPTAFAGAMAAIAALACLRWPTRRSEAATER